MENNWTINQTKQLFELAAQSAKKGEGLSAAFSKMAELSSRSVGSVRNYYYSQLKMFELVPKLAGDLGITVLKNQRKEFELFGEEEIVNLVESVLIEKAKGRSVRAIIAALAHNDSKKALRLQNKYRSMIAHHKEKIINLMNDLGTRGIVYYNPYTKQVVDGTSTDNLSKLGEYIGKLDAQEVGSFLSMIKKLM